MKGQVVALKSLTLWFGECNDLTLSPMAFCCVQSSHLRDTDFMKITGMSQVPSYNSNVITK